jgi:serine/threonine protein kinase
METDRGQQLLANRYQLLSPFRRDRGGIMWHAHDLRLKRDVAIKEVPPPYRVDEPDLMAARRQALREARSAARLSHPAIITVHDLLEDKGRLWIVTELLKGLTLSETVRHLGRLPVHWSAWVGYQLLAGIEHAHEAGVVHGDISPGNVLLTEDRVVLTDFGIAALEKDVASSTLPIIRSAPYMAPERMRGGPQSPASDLWSFGATLYCAVEGRPPFPGTGSLAVLSMALTRDPDPPSQAGPLQPILEALMRRDPEVRLTGAAAAALLADVLRRAGIPAVPPGGRVAGQPHAPLGPPPGFRPQPALGAPDGLRPYSPAPPPVHLSQSSFPPTAYSE